MLGSKVSKNYAIIMYSLPEQFNLTLEHAGAPNLTGEKVQSLNCGSFPVQE